MTIGERIRKTLLKFQRLYSTVAVEVVTFKNIFFFIKGIDDMSIYLYNKDS